MMQRRPERNRRRRRGLALAWGVVLAFVMTALSGCFVVYRAGMEVLYRHEPLPASRVVEDLAYGEAPSAQPGKHRLDLFLPVGEGWPTVIFVHGGGWRTGDKNLRVGGADIYGNIGRYLARRGVGAAVINYRLLPDVAWQGQFEDVARAVAWVRSRVGAYGGNPEALFLMGHSAGAHLASRVALDPALLDAFGLTPEALCGVIAVSGAGYDLTDEQRLQRSGGRDYFEARFGHVEDWPRRVSTARFAHAGAPPFLILYADGESPWLQRQSQRLDEALRRAGASSRVVVVPGQSHTRIILTLSRDDKTAGPALLDFIRTTRCREG